MANQKIDIKPKVYLSEGTRVKMTKVALSSKSVVGVGKVIYGKLKNDLVSGKSCYLKEPEFNTSHISEIKKTDSDDFIVTTDTSIYFVQKI